jgi:regulator of sirC expression with transglutaminase-like and TPR domain
MLRNLKDIHQQQGDEAQTVAVLNRLITLHPPPGASTAIAVWCAWSGERRAAMQDLQTYAQHAGAAQDLDMVEEQLAQLRASS